METLPDDILIYIGFLLHKLYMNDIIFNDEIYTQLINITNEIDDDDPDY